MRSDSRLLCAACVLIAAAIFPAYGQFFQEGNKLVGTGASGNPTQGRSVALSADGNTAIVGGASDEALLGAAWVFTRSSGGWSQQGNKLVPNDATGPFCDFGYSVALSSDGNTALIGGFLDDAAWVFTRSGNTWTQQGSKLVGTGESAQFFAEQGISVALSSDGNTALIGGWADNGLTGAAWVFTRSGTTWTQQGTKLVGSDASGAAEQGISVALSSDGNTALIGGPGDNFYVGAAWIFTRSDGVWSQQGNKLLGASGGSVALSGNGETALSGSPIDNINIGAVWAFTLSEGVWAQQGNKLVGSGYSGQPLEGSSAALSSNGNIALFGGPNDNNNVGAVWVFTRSAGVWTQQGNKLVGSGAVESAQEGISVALSSAGDVAMVGGPGDDNGVGAAWVFAVPKLSVSAPPSAMPGTSFNITVTALDSAGVTVNGYTDSIHFTSSDGAATLPADSTLTNGVGQFSVTLSTVGNQTITATDAIYANITATSGSVTVAPGTPTISKSFGLPSIPLNGYTTLGFLVSNPNTAVPLTGIGFTDTMPAGLVVSTPSALTGACGGGAITTALGSGSVTLSGAALAAGASCNFSLNVTPTSAGVKNNVTSAVTSPTKAARATRPRRALSWWCRRRWRCRWPTFR
jgi:hypothetical protein